MWVLRLISQAVHTLWGDHLHPVLQGLLVKVMWCQGQGVLLPHVLICTFTSIMLPSG